MRFSARDPFQRSFHVYRRFYFQSVYRARNRRMGILRPRRNNLPRRVQSCSSARNAYIPRNYVGNACFFLIRDMHGRQKYFVCGRGNNRDRRFGVRKYRKSGNNFVSRIAYKNRRLLKGQLIVERCYIRSFCGKSLFGYGRKSVQRNLFHRYDGKRSVRFVRTV